MTWKTANINIELSDVTITVDDTTLRSDVMLVRSDTFTILSDTKLMTTDLGSVIGAHNDAAAGKVFQLGGIAESSVPEEVADSDTVRVWFDTYGRQVPHGANLGLGAQDVNEVAPALTQYTKITGITQLTAPGSTADVNVSSMGLYGYAFTVAALDTNVIVGMTGNVDGTNYAYLPLDNSAVSDASITTNKVTVTANGTYAIYSSAPVNEARFTWITEAGGTAATIDADFFGRRK